MRFSDAWSISVRSVLAYKKRSLATVISISVLFGLIMMMNFVICGLKTSTLDASSEQLGGKTYLETQFGEDPVMFADGSMGLPGNVPEDSGEILLKRIKKYEGVAAGLLRTYDFDTVTKIGVGSDGRPICSFTPTSYKVIDASAVKDLLTVNLADIPDGKVPVLVQEKSVGQIEATHENYYVAGVLPNMMSGAITVNDGSILVNSLLSFSGGTNWHYDYLVDDGSGKIDRFFDEVEAESIESYRVAYDGEEPQYMGILSNREHPVVYTVAIFDNPYNAVRYFNYFTDGAEFGYNIFTGEYRTNDLFSNTLSLARNFLMLDMMLMVVEIVFLVIAIWIATATFTHLVSQEAQTIALYRSLGAGLADIALIYFCYILQLCLLAMGFCILIALIGAVIVSLLDAQSVSQALQHYYYLGSAPKVSMLGLDWRFPALVAVILLIAPASLLLSLKSFSAKNIARKLKEE